MARFQYQLRMSARPRGRHAPITCVDMPVMPPSPTTRVAQLKKYGEQVNNILSTNNIVGIQLQQKESLENPRKVLFLKYEEIKEEPDVQLRRIAAFLGCTFSEEEEEGGVVGGISRLCSFERLSNLEVNKTGKSYYSPNNVYFRKGEVGDWRNHLTDEMTIKLDQIVEEKFKGTGLKLC
nr:cytosolic sulfotransferase 12-like [Ipomoea batatas]